MRNLGKSNSQKQKAEKWVSGCGEEDMGRFHLMDIEFQFCKMKEVWRWMVGTVAQPLNVLSITELCI